MTETKIIEYKKNLKSRYTGMTIELYDSIMKANPVKKQNKGEK